MKTTKCEIKTFEDLRTFMLDNQQWNTVLYQFKLQRAEIDSAILATKDFTHNNTTFYYHLN